jgi:hypothetical protein
LTPCVVDPIPGGGREVCSGLRTIRLASLRMILYVPAKQAAFVRSVRMILEKNAIRTVVIICLKSFPGVRSVQEKVGTSRTRMFSGSSGVQWVE